MDILCPILRDLIDYLLHTFTQFVVYKPVYLKQCILHITIKNTIVLTDISTLLTFVDDNC